ncbi:hypothetical protein HAX54_039365 [Datura stramonium]|uniref:Peptidase A1 domain-containing protein n=1 Tax=Datura stramonium TaxID=4076 RepID=A0ABS8VMI6_DATST|nr:hypothetical protein [Datura stramonium]
MYKQIPSTICFFLVYSLTIVPILGVGETPHSQSQVQPKPNCQRSSSGGIIGSHKLERGCRFGPWSLNANGTKTPSSAKLVNSSRVGSMNKKQNSNSVSDPINSDYGRFTVKISLGTPRQDYNLIVDTGSGLTWVRCQSCTQGCMSDDPLYDPSKSSCRGTLPDPFDVTYSDKSFTKGIWGCDTLTIDDLGTIMNFQFGCGQENVDDENFGGAAGILGLGKGEFSLTSQSSQSMQMFSYFVPENGDADLHFGDEAEAKSNTCSNQFTSLVQGDDPVNYYLDLVGISVAGNELSVPLTETIIDSGTVITRLPRLVYYALRAVVRQSMLNYTLLSEEWDELMDTCYSSEGNEPIVFPEIKFHFGQESSIDVTLSKGGTIWRKSDTVICLAFAATESYEKSIIGIVQQRGFNVLYDLEGERIGFGTNCAAG